jgi:hypothetical protein
MKMRSTKKAVTKTAKRQTVAYAPKPQTAKREPLKPITGPIGPLPVAMVEEWGAEQVVLGKSGGLADILMRGLAWDVGRSGGDTTMDLALSTLRRFADELHTIHAALLSDEPDTKRIAHVAFSMAERAEMVEDLIGRLDQASKPLPSGALRAPPAHEVAAACLALSGVLSATSTWDRLLRIAERIDVRVTTDADFPTMGNGSYTVWPRERGGPSLPIIAIAPGAVDRDAVLARLLAAAVAKREGFGEVNDEWRQTFADIVLDRCAQKGVAA